MKPVHFPTHSTILIALPMLLIAGSVLAGCSPADDNSSDEARPTPTATTETVSISVEFVEWVSSTEGIVKNADDIYVEGPVGWRDVLTLRAR